MPSLSYHAPDSIAQAVSLLSGNPAARVLSGGTDLLVQMRAGRVAPAAIIDVKRIGALSGVRSLADGGFAIGAATACTALLANSALAAAWPGVVEAANLIGSVQVRNRATMAGNLCNASPAADSVPALIAAGATCLVAGPGGERVVAVEDIPTGPGKTSLAPGEFLVEFRLPAKPARTADAYLRFIPRTEMDIAVVGVGACLTLGADGTCTAARIGLGAVAPTALVATDAAQALVGTRLDEAVLDQMAKAIMAICNPISDKRGTAEYRTAMAGVLAKRAVLIARDRAQSDARARAGASA